jgi:hypothetical protein
MTTSTALKTVSMAAASTVVLALAGVGQAKASTLTPSLAPTFSNDYSIVDLGTVPDIPSAFGGLTFMPGDPNTLLVGALAATPDAGIYSVKVKRDSHNNITGFGEVSFLAKAPGTVDGGLDAGLTSTPNSNVLFYTTYPDNSLGQIKPGSSEPDKQIDLTSLGIAPSSGAVAFVPEGFPGAGRLKITSYTENLFYDTTITPDGSGTYDIASPTTSVKLEGGLDGFVYVRDSNPGFSVNSLLIQEYDTNRISAYEIDEKGNPIATTRRDFMTGFGNQSPTASASMGATTDPLTGNPIFTAFFEGVRSISRIFNVKRVDGCPW